MPTVPAAVGCKSGQPIPSGRQHRLGSGEPAAPTITGGLGGLGLGLARLTAWSRTEASAVKRIHPRAPGVLPAPSARDRWDLPENATGEVAGRIAAVRELEELGSGGRGLAADVADETQLGPLGTVRERFGPLNGSSTRPGHPASGLLALKTRADAERVLRPKVGGALARGTGAQRRARLPSSSTPRRSSSSASRARATTPLPTPSSTRSRTGPAATAPVTAVDWGPRRWDAWPERRRSPRWASARTLRHNGRPRIRPAHPHPCPRIPRSWSPSKTWAASTRWRSSRDRCRHSPASAPHPSPRCARRTARRDGSGTAITQSGGAIWGWTGSAPTTSLRAGRHLADRPHDRGRDAEGRIPHQARCLDLFEAPTPGTLAALVDQATRRRHVAGGGSEPDGAGRGDKRREQARAAAAAAAKRRSRRWTATSQRRHTMEIDPDTLGRVAIIGMSGRFPGAADVDQLWRNICGAWSPSPASPTRSCARPASRRTTWPNPLYVKAGAVLDGIELFDAGFFGIPPQEAQLLDPQQRLFLEHRWAALEDAAATRRRFDGSVGVFAGSALSTYLLQQPPGQRGCRPGRPLQVVLGQRQGLPGHHDRVHPRPARARLQRAELLLDLAGRGCDRLHQPGGRRLRRRAGGGVRRRAAAGRLPLPGGRHRLTGRQVPGVRRRGAGQPGGQRRRRGRAQAARRRTGRRGPRTR